MIQKTHKLSVRRQCQLLRINRSSVYCEAKEPAPEAVALRETLMREIDVIHTQKPALGQRKIVRLLQNKGFVVGRKLVRRLMREMGLHTVYPKANLSKRNFKEAIVPYLLRNVNVQFPNQVWSIDITYIRMEHGHMYLAAVIDWFSRKIVGWDLSDTLEPRSAIAAIGQAVETFGTPGILNSDQGSQFTSEPYKQLLRDLHIRQSMDGKSRWADNIMIERWFRSLKTEMIYINEFHSQRELRRAIQEYIRSYNSFRPHQALDYATPDEVYCSSFAATPSAGLDSAPLACCPVPGEGATESGLDRSPSPGRHCNRPASPGQGNLLTQAAAV